MNIRTEKNKNNPYVIIRKTVFDDERLSLKAKGLMAYLLSKPNNWKAHVTEIAKNNADGVTAVRSAVNELIAFGYASRVQNRENGRIVSWELVVYEVPDLNPELDLLDVENLDVENLNVENLIIENNPLISNEGIVNNNHQQVPPIKTTIEKHDDDEPSSGDVFRMLEKAGVFVSPLLAEQYHELTDELTAAAVIEGIKIATGMNKQHSIKYIASCARNWKNGTGPIIPAANDSKAVQTMTFGADPW